MYVEGIFFVVAAPLAVSLLCVRGRPRIALAGLLTGMLSCLVSSYVSSYPAGTVPVYEPLVSAMVKVSGWVSVSRSTMLTIL